MKNLDKLRVLLPHWITHNQGHGGEYADWADRIASDQPEISDLLKKAASALTLADTALSEALHRAGGPLDSPHHHHHEEE